MSNCINCGARLPYDATSCQYCGTQQTSAAAPTSSYTSTTTTTTQYFTNTNTHTNTDLGLDDISSGVYPRGDFGRRLLAAFLDSFFVGLLFIPLIINVALSENNKTTTGDELSLASWLWLSIPFTYLMFKDGLSQGRSLGKMAAGLLVIDIGSQRPIGFAKSAGRNLGSGVMGLVPLGGIIDGILVLTDDDGRKVGDRMAGTKVINASDYRN